MATNGNRLPDYLAHASKDPAAGINGMPPNLGRDLVPHVITFQGVLSTISKVYRASDEALKVSRENARCMLNDPVITECLEHRQRAVALLNWHLEPDDAKDKKQVEGCDQLKAVIEKIPRFMQYRENLLQAIWFGRYGISQWWTNRKIRGQWRMCIEDWRPVHGDKIVFRYDDGSGDYDPNQIGIRVGPKYLAGQRIGENIVEHLEPVDYGMGYFLKPWQRDLLALHKHKIEDGEYEEPQNAGRIHGVGIRSKIYWAWYQKQEALAWLMEFLERSAFGIELWHYPAHNTEAREQMRKAAQERIGGNRNIILVPVPAGDAGDGMYGVQRLEPGMGGADALDKIINTYFGHQIKRYILGQTLTTEAENTGLGSNLAAIHLDTFMQIVQYDSTNLEETISTDLVEPLIRHNKEFAYLIDCPPRFRIDTQTADAEQKLEAFQKAWDMGLKIPAQDVMDVIGSRKPDQDEEVLSKQQMMQAQQSAELLGSQPGGKPTQLEMFGPGDSPETTDHVEATWAALTRNREAAKATDIVARKLGIADPADADRERVSFSRQEAIEYIKQRLAG